ncbi:MAG: hypothetical protein HC896_03795 [Bacteroidales bacterium]|nr:hypothetical protein [Bacteroidales bacterium]
MKKLVKYISLCAVLGSGCSEEFFEGKGKKGEIDQESFYKSEKGLNEATRAAYQPLARVFRMDNANMIFESIASDDAEAGGQNLTDQPAIQDIDKFTFNPANEFFKTLWAYNYKGIYLSNLVIANAQQYINDVGPNQDSPVYNYLGEAYFLRGLYYFRLNKFFGGVPLLDESALNNINDYYTVKRSTIAETFRFIKSDLHKAQNLMLAKANIDGYDLGRATKEAAWGFLSKVYLYESSYAKNYAGDERFLGCEQHYDSVCFFRRKGNSIAHKLLRRTKRRDLHN